MASDVQTIHVEVSFAMPEEQTVIPLDVSPESTIQEVIDASGILRCCPEVPQDLAHVGVFGKAKKLTETLRDGDRVEIYRPLKADPKEVRRRLAAEGKTMDSRADRKGAS
ncbi:MAG: RnfH family protein [Gammaproteobacteria bacterium]